MEHSTYDVAVVGGGLVGLGTLWAVQQQFQDLRCVLLEKEARLASHQSGRNSGVIHSGVYYRPGSLKAQLCRAGSQRLRAFCDAHGIRYERCGKLIVAVERHELVQLDRLYERGQANGVTGLHRLESHQIQEVEPRVQGVAALHLPEVSVVDFIAVAQTLAAQITEHGGTILTSTPLLQLHHVPTGWRLGTTRGTYEARFLINCSGLHADRIARMAHERPAASIIPFRGEYYTLRPDRRELVHGLVYPVPDPGLPFLGVHFTKTISGEILVGPNAVLALKREGYCRSDVSCRDVLGLLGAPGFWRMAARYWRVGLEELSRSFSKRAFVRAAQRLIPSLREEDLIPGHSGVRAQAIDVGGNLLDDFLMRESRAALHVYNAPSPAGTASLSIGQAIAERIAEPLKQLRRVTATV